ncbi:MAG: hypothetical protein ACEQSB_06425 [Undibacterium sp.]
MLGTALADFPETEALRISAFQFADGVSHRFLGMAGIADGLGFFRSGNDHIRFDYFRSVWIPSFGMQAPRFMDNVADLSVPRSKF